MKIENQVCTLLQAKRLNDFGIKQGLSAFFFDEYREGLCYNNNPKGGYWNAESCFSAFTVAELGVMLQGFIIPEWKQDYRCLPDTKFMWLICTSPNHYYACAETEAQARSEYVIYLLENNLITADEVNARL